MRPIDVIKSKTDADLVKYHNSYVCVIPTEEDIKDFVGIGIMALVVPITLYDAYEKKLNEMKPDKFPVVIVNRTSGWWETDMASKYYVVTLNPIHDRVTLSIGFLVPKTLIGDSKHWVNLRMEDGSSVDAMSKEYNSDGSKG